MTKVRVLESFINYRLYVTFIVIQKRADSTNIMYINCQKRVYKTKDAKDVNSQRGQLQRPGRRRKESYQPDEENR